jgi:hypothetical protein
VLLTSRGVAWLLKENNTSRGPARGVSMACTHARDHRSEVSVNSWIITHHTKPLFAPEAALHKQSASANYAIVVYSISSTRKYLCCPVEDFSLIPRDVSPCLTSASKGLSESKSLLKSWSYRYNHLCCPSYFARQKLDRGAISPLTTIHPPRLPVFILL